LEEFVEKQEWLEDSFNEVETEISTPEDDVLTLTEYNQDESLRETPLTAATVSETEQVDSDNNGLNFRESSVLFGMTATVGATISTVVVPFVYLPAGGSPLIAAGGAVVGGIVALVSLFQIVKSYLKEKK
jgi:hypothetical protein